MQIHKAHCWIWRDLIKPSLSFSFGSLCFFFNLFIHHTVVTTFYTFGCSLSAFFMLLAARCGPFHVFPCLVDPVWCCDHLFGKNRERVTFLPFVCGMYCVYHGLFHLPLCVDRICPVSVALPWYLLQSTLVVSTTPLFHNIFNISLTSGVKLHIYLCEMWLFNLLFPQFCKFDMSMYGPSQHST